MGFSSVHPALTSCTCSCLYVFQVCEAQERDRRAWSGREAWRTGAAAPVFRGPSHHQGTDLGPARVSAQLCLPLCLPLPFSATSPIFSGISGHLRTKHEKRNKLLSAFHPLASLDKDQAVGEMGKGSRNQNYLCSSQIAFLCALLPVSMQLSEASRVWPGPIFCIRIVALKPHSGVGLLCLPGRWVPEQVDSVCASGCGQ